MSVYSATMSSRTELTSQVSSGVQKCNCLFHRLLIELSNEKQLQYQTTLYLSNSVILLIQICIY